MRDNVQGSVIRECGCKHPYQDSKYGYRNRVHNVCKGKKANVCRCTVCGAEKSL